MNDTDLCYTPATELIALIRAKKLSPVELTRAVLARIERLNPKVNAFCTLTADLARDAARRAEEAVMSGDAPGLILGLPFSIKDLALTAGIRTMGGSPIFEHRVPDTDAPFVRRLKEAGGVMLGKTTTPEFGWKALGDSPITGITRNPWNLGMTSGGSSAGAGVAAAAGLGPLHQGSDGAGSIRIPSAFCGVFGLKPSYGRVPMWPTSNTDSASHTGPMTRTVGDAALMLSVMAGPDPFDRTALDAEPADYVARLDDGVRGLRIAWSPDFGGLRVDPDVALVAKQAALAFQGLGAAVEEVKPAFADSREIIRCMWNVHEAGNYGQFLAEYRDRMDPGLVASIEDGLALQRRRVRGHARSEARVLGFRAAALREVRPPAVAQRLRRRLRREPAEPQGLAGSSVGLVRLGLVQLSVQLHRAARCVHPRRLHAGRHARRPSDRWSALGRPDRAPGLARLRASAPLGIEAPAGGLGHSEGGSAPLPMPPPENRVAPAKPALEHRRGPRRPPPSLPREPGCAGEAGARTAVPPTRSSRADKRVPTSGGSGAERRRIKSAKASRGGRYRRRSRGGHE